MQTAGPGQYSMGFRLEFYSHVDMDADEGGSRLRRNSAQAVTAGRAVTQVKYNLYSVGAGHESEHVRPDVCLLVWKWKSQALWPQGLSDTGTQHWFMTLHIGGCNW